MKKCLNCQNDVRDTDIYCRYCGCLLEKNNHYILINVLTVFVIIGIILLVVLFIASFLIEG